MFRLVQLVLLLLLPLNGFASECVVLLHGLARTAGSMNKLEKALSNENYLVANIGYPSRSKTVEELAEPAVAGGIKACRDKSADKIHFVAHSLGGILVRQYASRHTIPNLGRVVMLAPPNQGSQVVDKFKNFPGFRFLNGPAGMQLGTARTDVPRQLGAVDFELGVIAGTKSINLILSSVLPNPDDGKVSVENAKVAGMRDFITVPSSHPFLMKNPQAIKQVIHFLKNGRFLKPKGSE